jgi:hypothetical protein
MSNMSRVCWIVCVGLLLATGCSQTLAPSTGFQRIESELIFSVMYYPNTEVLSVLLNEEGGRDFENVTEESYKALMNAADKDEFFRKNIQKKFKSTPWE